MVERADVRDAAVVATALGLLTALAWLYLFAYGARMDMAMSSGMAAMSPPPAMPAGPDMAAGGRPMTRMPEMSTGSFSGEVAALSVMWAVMMAR